MFSPAKHVFMESTTLFISKTGAIYTNPLIFLTNKIKDKGNITLNIFQNFAYVSNYLETKTSGWKQDFAISSNHKCYDVEQGHLTISFQFLTTLNVLIVIIFVTFLQNQLIYNF